MRETSRFLPLVPASVGAARRFVAATCAAWGLSATDSVLLMTSELVTDAVERGGSGVSLQVTYENGLIRIAVTGATGPPPRRDGDLRIDCLELVGALATSWGVQPAQDGTVAWFESVA